MDAADARMDAVAALDHSDRKGDYPMNVMIEEPPARKQEKESWKPVPGYEDHYKVSNYGNMQRTKKGGHTKIGENRKPAFDKQGYAIVVLFKNGARKGMLVHRLVMLAFVGEPPDETYQVNHKNCNPSDNRLSNLEWVTPSDNLRHSYKYGKSNVSGERNPSAKLTKQDVEKIRKLLNQGALQKEIARAFGVHKRTISDIAGYRSWIEMD